MPGGDDNGLGKGPYDMVRDEKGVWTVTIPPAVPGFHYYWLSVDGFPANDPAHPHLLRVEQGVAAASKCRTRAGLLRRARTCRTAMCAPAGTTPRPRLSWRRAYVYTPPDYDRTRERGTRCSIFSTARGRARRGWTAQGRANFILDNLIAAKKAQPMIIVMENGMVAAKAGARPAPAQPGAAPRGNAAFEEVVINDLIPMIDAAYRTLAGQDEPGHRRAVDGGRTGGSRSGSATWTSSPTSAPSAAGDPELRSEDLL